MKSTRGNPRKLSDAQVRHICETAEAVRTWRARVSHIPTIQALAREIGVHPTALWRVIARGPDYRHESFRLGRPGRPVRAYEPATLKRIFDWHRQLLAAQASSPPPVIQAQLAQNLRISLNTLREILNNRLIYKQCAPEERNEMRSRRARRLSRLRALNLY